METLPHLVLKFPSHLFNTTPSPQNLDQGHLLLTKVLSTAIQDLHNLLIIWQVGTELQLLVLDLMRLIRHIPPYKRNMKHGVHC